MAAQMAPEVKAAEAITTQKLMVSHIGAILGHIVEMISLAQCSYQTGDAVCADQLDAQSQSVLGML